MQMQFLLIGVALFMAVAIVWRYTKTRQTGDLFRGLAWFVFVGFIATRSPFFLYVAIALFIIGLISRQRDMMKGGVPHTGYGNRIDVDQQEIASPPPLEIGENPLDTLPPIAQAQVPAPLACVPIDKEIAVQLTVRQTHEYATDDARQLRLAPGHHMVRLTCRLLPSPPAEENAPVDILEITHRLADAGGQEWEASVTAPASLIGDALQRAVQQAASEDAGAQRIFLEDSVPAAWREALVRHCLLANVQDTRDDWQFDEFTIADRNLYIAPMLQPPLYDLGWLASQGLFIVRARRVFQLASHAQAATSQAEMLPPIFFAMHPDELLLCATTYESDTPGALSAVDEPQSPITFHLTGQISMPNSGVHVI